MAIAVNWSITFLSCTGFVKILYSGYAGLFLTL